MTENLIVAKGILASGLYCQQKSFNSKCYSLLLPVLRAWAGDMEIRKDDNIRKEFMVLTHDTVPTNESETKKVLREKKGSTHGYYCLMPAHM